LGGAFCFSLFSGMTGQGREQLYLVDGYALIYRSFFAMISRPLRTSRGENTSAVWGVANFLHRLFEQRKPRYIAWVHDAGSSFRNQAYPSYKATREKLDAELQEDFDRSVERVEQLLEAFRIPLVTVDGYEADDVIGTMAARAGAEGLLTIIVSGDKDFYQLINENVMVLNPGRGGPAPVDESIAGPSNAAERLGVPPERVVDYLALVGDSSDNIPGVKGIGDKTARALIEAYGDLESILAHAADVKGKRAREGLLQYADDARLSRELVTILLDVPVELDLLALRTGSPDQRRLTQLYGELEFSSLLGKLDNTQAAVGLCKPIVVEDARTLTEIVTAVRELQDVALDLRMEGPVRGQWLVGLSLFLVDGRAWYLPLGHRTPEGILSAGEPPRNLPSLSDPVMRPIVELLQDPKVRKSGHDMKRVSLALRGQGITLTGVDYDSMLASFVLDPSRRSHALDVLAREHLNLELKSESDLVGKGKSARPLSEVPTGELADLSAASAEAVSRLRRHFATQLDSTGGSALLADIEMPLINVLVDMEWSGIAVDTARLAELSRHFSVELRDIEHAVYEAAGSDFNINSTPQLRHVLFDKLQLPVIKRTKTGPSTDAAVLAQLADMGFDVPRLLLEYRELSKLKSTYVDVLPQSVNGKTGRVHTSFNQTGAATGRLSSSDPNLQNIPVRTARGELIRECFVPSQGCRFIVADYSQIELRVLAHLSHDAAFIEAFLQGGDIHRQTGAIIFGVAPEDVTSEMRAKAKTINFATIYGQGPFSLAKQLGISQEEAKEFIRLYFSRFSGVRRFLDDTVEKAKAVGYVETLFGRRRYIPELKDPNYNVRAFGERTAMNSPMQGSAADLIKVAMISLSAAIERESLESAVLLQVHDELVLESPESELEQVCETVRREMEGAANLDVPLLVDVGVGSNWLDAKA
jgi:DNA polymerase-1